MIKFLDIQRITESFQPELSNAAERVIASGWYLQGEETKAFEREFAASSHAPHCVGVANGLDALYLTLAAKRTLEPSWLDGDEVIVPSMTFVATAEAVLRAGLTPVLVDVDENALLDTSLARLEAAVTPRTRAVIPVHLYGQTVDMDRVMSFAEAHHLFVLEDACQAHGGRDVAAKAHASAFSFYPGKNLGALGDGGALVTHNEELARRVRALANYGASRKYYHEYQGINSRLDEVQAAMLRVKLRRLDTDNHRRQEVARAYYAGIRNPHVRLLQQQVEGSVWHIFPLFTADRDALQAHLASHSVQSLIHYPLALHQQPGLQGAHRVVGSQQHAEDIAAHELSIPISPVMTDDEIAQVVVAVNSYNPA